jgi:hypothetical protein
MRKFRIACFFFGRIPIGCRFAKILQWCGAPRYAFLIRIPIIPIPEGAIFTALDIVGVQPMSEPDPNSTWKFNMKYSDDTPDEDKFNGGCF